MKAVFNTLHNCFTLFTSTTAKPSVSSPGMLVYVAHIPIQSVVIYPELVGKPPIHRKRRILLYMLFWTLEMPTTTIWAAFQIQHLSWADVVWFKHGLRLNTTSLLRNSGLRYGSCIPGHDGFHSSSISCPSTQEPCLRPPFQEDLGTDSQLCPSRAHGCSHSSNEQDFVVNTPKIDQYS